MHVGTYSTDLHKMVYLQNRRYLPADSELRQDKKNFPSKHPEMRDPPSKRVYESLKDVHLAYDAAPTK